MIFTESAAVFGNFTTFPTAAVIWRNQLELQSVTTWGQCDTEQMFQQTSVEQTSVSYMSTHTHRVSVVIETLWMSSEGTPVSTASRFTLGRPACCVLRPKEIKIPPLTFRLLHVRLQVPFIVFCDSQYLLWVIIFFLQRSVKQCDEFEPLTWRQVSRRWENLVQVNLSHTSGLALTRVKISASVTHWLLLLHRPAGVGRSARPQKKPHGTNKYRSGFDPDPTWTSAPSLAVTCRFLRPLIFLLSHPNCSKISPSSSSLYLCHIWLVYQTPSH